MCEVKEEKKKISIEEIYKTLKEKILIETNININDLDYHRDLEKLIKTTKDYNKLLKLYREDRKDLQVVIYFGYLEKEEIEESKKNLRIFKKLLINYKIYLNILEETNFIIVY